MHPQLSYLICATHRTGSTLLCELLKSTGLAGQPEEFFWSGYEQIWMTRWGTASYAEYLLETLRRTTTPNGVFGAKIMWAYLDDFLERVRQIPAYADLPAAELLSGLFPNLSYICITRRDKVRQAVSLWKAVQTEVWQKSIDGSPLPLKRAVYDFHAIDYWLEVILWQEASWQEFFAALGISPLTIVYEDFIDSYESTTTDILWYLGIAGPGEFSLAPPSLHQQADKQSEEWVERFIEQKNRTGTN